MPRKKEDDLIVVVENNGKPSLHTGRSFTDVYLSIAKAFNGDKKAIRAAIREGQAKIYSRDGKMEKRVTGRAL